MTEDVIAAHGLRKRYGPTVALDGLDLNVTAGEVHGFLGPNGAGKTTTLRIVLGLAQRDEGVLDVLGADPWREAVTVHRQVAYVPGDVQLWPSLTGGQTIDLLLRMRKVPSGRRDELIERFDLDPTMKVGAYSKGNRQKVALIAALAAQVPLYLFDEPTDGLDPLMAQVYRDCVGEITGAGGTVLLSSHLMAEVEAVADRVTIIRAGRAVETGTLAQLRHLTRTRVTATTSRPVVGLAHEDVHDLVIDGDRVTCDVGPGALGPVLAALQRAGVTTLDCRPPSLEEIFLRHYGPAAPAGDAGESLAAAPSPGSPPPGSGPPDSSPPGSPPPAAPADRWVPAGGAESPGTGQPTSPGPREGEPAPDGDPTSPPAPPQPHARVRLSGGDEPAAPAPPAPGDRPAEPPTSAPALASEAPAPARSWRRPWSATSAPAPATPAPAARAEQASQAELDSTVRHAPPVRLTEPGEPAQAGESTSPQEHAPPVAPEPGLAPQGGHEPADPPATPAMPSVRADLGAGARTRLWGDDGHQSHDEPSTTPGTGTARVRLTEEPDGTDAGADVPADVSTIDLTTARDADA